jgi:YggT family protein
MTLIINIVQLITTLLTICIIGDILVSYFLSPYHPVRSFLDKIVQPMLTPIRRFVPLIGMLDFSPFILLLIIQLLERIIIQVLVLIAYR